MSKLIYDELTYKLNGIFFKVHNELGRYCNENQVCNRIEANFTEEKIPYHRELVLPPSFEGEKYGRNRVDFIVWDKIILETKCKRHIGREEYYQLQRYLHTYNKKLGILVNFRDERLKPRRVINKNFKA